MATIPPGLSLRLVPLAEIDAAATAALINEAFHRHDIMDGDRTSPAELVSEVGPAAEFLQATHMGRLIGTAMVQSGETALARDDPFPAEFLPGGFYYGLAAVANRAASQGIGRLLLEESEALARERGYRRMLLGTVREFGLPAYYEKQGYRVVAEHPFEAGHWSIVVPHSYCEMVKDL